MTTAEAITLIEAAAGPGDLFGSAGPGGLFGSTGPGAAPGGSGASRAYRRLARLTHPDANPGNPRAVAAFARLAELWQRYRDTGARRLLRRGDIANLYLAGDRVLKLARDPHDNDLMDREAAALAWMRSHADGAYLAYLPHLAGRQRQQDPATGIQRRANLIGWLDGFVSLADVRSAYPGGVDPRDAAWMWRRLLVAIGTAHRAGVIHAAILPEHVMIHPADHGLVLADWCYSVSAPAGPVAAIVSRYRDWYPAEVLARRPPGPDLDIYLASACMSYLMASRAPARLAAFARGCQLASPRRRPQDAWRLLAELDELLERLYGPRRFRPFAMPA